LKHCCKGRRPSQQANRIAFERNAIALVSATLVHHGGDRQLTLSRAPSPAQDLIRRLRETVGETTDLMFDAFMGWEKQERLEA
jgi:L-alanine-DL-glutamate epimerase-like enolase superfamily enzyme